MRKLYRSNQPSLENLQVKIPPDFFFQISAYLATIKKDVVEGQRYYSSELENGKLDQTKEKMYQQALMQIDLVNSRLEMI